jgi:phosphoglycolate phosphatase-like HAD superfamily hydrolase
MTTVKRLKKPSYILSMRMDETAMRAQLHTLGLSSFFRDAVAVMGRSKHEALSKIPDACCIVGDTEHDIVAGQAFSMTTIAVTTGIRSREYLETLRPTHIVDDIIDVLDIA